MRFLWKKRFLDKNKFGNNRRRELPRRAHVVLETLKHVVRLSQLRGIGTLAHKVMDRFKARSQEGQG